MGMYVHYWRRAQGKPSSSTAHLIPLQRSHSVCGTPISMAIANSQRAPTATATATATAAATPTAAATATATATAAGCCCWGSSLRGNVGLHGLHGLPRFLVFLHLPVWLFLSHRQHFLKVVVHGDNYPPSWVGPSVSTPRSAVYELGKAVCLSGKATVPQYSTQRRSRHRIGSILVTDACNASFAP